MDLKSQYFSQQSFESPPRLFAPVYTWVWNEPVTRDGIDIRLDSMVSRNIRAVYVLPEPKHFRPLSMITSLEPEYLSDEFFSLIRYTADAAGKRGISLWLYDEGGWPSGSACGQVVRNNPALAQKIIRQDKIILAAGDILTDSKDTLAVFTTDFRRIILPFTASDCIDVFVYKIARVSGPDLLNPDTTDEFIRITHEEYKKATDCDMSHHFFAAFTDEPSVNYPVYPNDPEGFLRRFGYNLCDRLPALFDGNDMGEAGINARLDYCDYYSAEVADNYYGKIRSWCAENGIFSSGHLNGDDNFLTVRTHGGHILRHLRCFDIPAIDAIWRQIHPSEKAVNNFFPRFASSAAAQNGTVLAASESFAVYGAGTTYGEMRYALYFQAVRGINLFNFMLISYGNHSFTASQERPCFQPEMPGSGDITPFNDFTARLSYIAAVGQASHRSALYYPIRDIWADGGIASSAVNGFEHIGRSLERLQTGFDIIDDDIIRLSSLENGRFVIGSAVYDTVYLPECKYIPDDVRRRLLEFEKQNGQLFYNIAITAPVVLMKPQIKDIRASKRETDDGDTIYIIYNEGFAHAETVITFNGNLPAYELDPVNGCIYTSSAAVTLSLECGEGRIFFFVSDDDGKSFYQAKGRIVLDETAYSDTGIQEPGLIERNDGVLWVYARTDRGFQYESFSFDGLRSFTPVRQSCFTSPASPMKIKRNPATGILYSVWNPIPNYNGRTISSAGWGRTPLAIAKSTDDGLSWSPLLLLEDDDERGYCYPALCFTADGCLLIAYCRGGTEDGMCLCRLGIKKIKLDEI